MVAKEAMTIRFLLASRQCELAGLRDLLESGELTGKLSVLIHHLQRERGAVNLYLCNEGQQTADELRQREQDSLSSQQALLAYLEQPGALTAKSQASRLLSCAARGVYALSVLPEVRRKIFARSIPLMSAVDIFNDTLRHLLSMVYAVSDTSADPVISRALIALFSFMQGKELAGQERAIGVRVFSAHLPGETHGHYADTMIDLIERQEQCFETFTAFGDPKNNQYWSDMTTDREFERLRRLACTRTSASGTPGTGQHWFVVATQRIDEMKLLEDRLLQTVMQLCRERITATEQACHEQQADIESLKEAVSQGDSGFSVFMRDPATGEQLAQRSGWINSEGIQPQLGQSLLSLLRQQSRRLDAQSQELSALRETLNQRKTIDSAKKLLMQHRQISEDEAYKTLRQMAMDQNKKIAEIAAAILSVAGAFGSR